MSIFKCVNDSNNDHDSFEYIVNYATKKPYTNWDTNVGTKGCRKDAIIRDMVAVKEAYHKNNGKLYEHVVFSITPDYKSVPDADYMEIGRLIADHYDGYQCVYALHKDTRIRHLHFIFNTVSYKDGKKYSQGPPDLNRIKMYCNHILEKLDFDPIRSNPIEMVDTDKHYFADGWRFLEIDNDEPDDRNLLLVEPPQTEEDNINEYAEAYEYSCFGDYSAWYNNISGGYNMNSPFNYPSVMPQSEPSVTQATAMTIAQGCNSESSLNLVNINNIKLNSPDDLGQAISDMSVAFNDAAKTGAEAMAVLRQRGVTDGVTVTTVNNYYINSINDSTKSVFDPINTLYNQNE